MTRFRIVAYAVILSSAACITAASPVFGASAHNSQIGAAGPTTDPYSSDPTAQSGVAILGYKAIRVDKAGGKRSAPCARGELRTELERRRCE